MTSDRNRHIIGQFCLLLLCCLLQSVLAEEVPPAKPPQETPAVGPEAGKKTADKRVRKVPELPRTLSAALILAPYERIPFTFEGLQLFKGNGSAGEVQNGRNLYQVGADNQIAGRKVGIGVFTCAIATSDPQNPTGPGLASFIVLSAFTNNLGNANVQYTNPPVRIAYRQPLTGRGVEAVDYRCHNTYFTAMACSESDYITLVGTPPALTNYNQSVRVGRRPMGVVLTSGALINKYAFVTCQADGTLAAVSAPDRDWGSVDERLGETTFFDAATGKQLERREPAEQRISAKKPFAVRPTPVSKLGQKLAPGDIRLIQSGHWLDYKGGETFVPVDSPDQRAYVIVANYGGGSVMVFDILPFITGKGRDLVLLGGFPGIPNPRKMLLWGDDLYVGSNPGTTVSKLSLRGLPAIAKAKPLVIQVGKDPMGMAMGHNLLWVANSGSDSVSVVRDDREIGRLDRSNSMPMKEPYGIYCSGEGARVIVTNRGDEYATWWNLKMYPAGPVERPEDLIISSDRLWVGPGATAIDGDYNP